MVTEPIVKPLPNGYEFLWCEGEEWVIAISIVKISESHGALSGELSIKHEFKDKPTISGIRFNLVSQQARNTISKRLIEAKIISGFDWAQIIDQICAETIKRHREGEPHQELWTSEDIQPPGYLLEPLMPLNQPTIIFGEGGIGKSEMALVILICLSLPWYDNPLGLIAPDHSVKILYLDYETDEREILWKAKCLQLGMDLPPFNVNYRRCNAPLSNDIESVQNIINDIKAEAVIIDSLGYASGGELKESSPAINFFSSLRKLKTTSLILAHTSKDKEAKVRSVFGSAYFTFAARSIWEARKSQEVGENELSIALFHRKANLSRLHHPLGYKLNFNEHKTLIEIEDTRSVGEFLKEYNTQTRIYELLKSEPMSVKDISEALELTEGNIRMAISRLNKKGKIVKRGELYGLVANV